MTATFKPVHRLLGAAAMALVAAITVPGKGLAETAPITDRSAVGELNFWNSIKESTDPADIKRYLDEFPDGMFVDPAVARYEQLTGQKLGLRSVENTSASTDDASTDMQANPEPPPKPVVKASSKKKVTAKAAKKSTKKAVSNKKSKKKVTSKKSTKKAVSKKNTVNKKKVSAKKVSCAQNALNCRRPGAGGGGSSGGGGWN